MFQQVRCWYPLKKDFITTNLAQVHYQIPYLFTHTLFTLHPPFPPSLILPPLNDTLPMTAEQVTFSPGDGKPCVTRPLSTTDQAIAVLDRAKRAFAPWKAVPLHERVAVVLRMVDHFVAKKEEIAREISIQMGRYAVVCGVRRERGRAD